MVKPVKVVNIAAYSLFISFLLIFSSGCQTAKPDNNSKNIWDMVEFFMQKGIRIESMQPLLTAPLNCKQAVALKIAGRQIGLYKYNTRWKKAKKRLAKINKEGHVFILGRKIDAIVNGSFVMIDYTNNKEKEKLVDAFTSF